jgi:L-lactate dehydrogenase complex protein LldE
MAHISPLVKAKLIVLFHLFPSLPPKPFFCYFHERGRSTTFEVEEMRAQLFGTCLVDTFYPETGEAVLKLLKHFDVDVEIPRGQTCCGKPADSAGYSKAAIQAAEHFFSVFTGSDPIIVPSGSCASMIKNHYPRLFEDNPAMKAKADQVAGRVYELTQFLVHGLRAQQSGAFSRRGRVTYHASCQLTRELGVREEPLLLLQSIKGLDFVPLQHADRCCGFGGAFMAKSPEISKAIADEKAETIANSGAETVTGCDHGCLMNITDALKRRRSPVEVKHIAVLLAESLSK